jgi:hypothetical protein
VGVCEVDDAGDDGMTDGVEREDSREELVLLLILL